MCLTRSQVDMLKACAKSNYKLQGREHLEELECDGGSEGGGEVDLGGGSVGLEELGLRKRGVPGFWG